MPEMPKRDPDPAETGSASIEQLLDAERAVEARLAEARKTAAGLVADAYDAAQAIERRTDARIARLARDCAQENDRRVAAILAEAEGIASRPVETEPLRDAIREAAGMLAARLTRSEP